MITLSRKPKPVPPLYEAVDVPSGRVFVAKLAEGRYRGQLAGGKHAVLEADGGSLELTTMAGVRGAVTEEGTYVNEADLLSLGEKCGKPTTPTLRKYKAGDTLRKAFSPAGAILLILTALGVLAAVAGLFVAIVGESSTSAAAVSERSQTLISWVTAPADRLEGADSPEVALGRRFIHRREATAQRCLRSLAGGEPSKESPGGVSCEPKSPPWWKDKDKGALLALWIGLATTLLGLFGVSQKFGFGSSPD